VKGNQAPGEKGGGDHLGNVSQLKERGSTQVVLPDNKEQRKGGEKLCPEIKEGDQKLHQGPRPKWGKKRIGRRKQLVQKKEEKVHAGNWVEMGYTGFGDKT